MAQNHDAPTLEERYSGAARSSDLTVHPDHRGDADLLIAAGLATSHTTRGAVAMKIWRMQADGTRIGIGQVADQLAEWPHRAKMRARNRTSRRVAETVLAWMLSSVCIRCQGRKYELVPGTQVTSEHFCQLCDGGGRPPLEPLLGQNVEAGRWLVATINALYAEIFDGMARRGRQQIDEALSTSVQKPVSDQ
jgi:hypothetical protein